jgi:hypothetical protein
MLLQRSFFKGLQKIYIYLMESYSSLFVIIGTITLVSISYSLKGQTKTVVNKDTTLKEFISNTSIKGYSIEQTRSYYKRRGSSI